VLTERARAEACRRVGKDAHAVAGDLGVGWATVMRTVADHGGPLVDDAARLEGVAALDLVVVPRQVVHEVRASVQVPSVELSWPILERS
jgi:hypothetical protein